MQYVLICIQSTKKFVLQYGIKKREDPFAVQDDGGGFGRKRKTPEELAAEARGETGEEGE